MVRSGLCSGLSVTSFSFLPFFLLLSFKILSYGPRFVETDIVIEEDALGVVIGRWLLISLTTLGKILSASYVPVMVLLAGKTLLPQAPCG